MRPRVKGIVERLVVRTRAGEVHWEMEGNYAVRATIGDYRLVVSDSGSEDRTQYSFTVRRLSDSIDIDSVVARASRVASHSENFKLLQELWQVARDEAIGVDSVFDEIEAALGGSEEIDLDALPFE